MTMLTDMWLIRRTWNSSDICVCALLFGDCRKAPTSVYGGVNESASTIIHVIGLTAEAFILSYIEVSTCYSAGQVK